MDVSLFVEDDAVSISAVGYSATYHNFHPVIAIFISGCLPMVSRRGEFTLAPNRRLLST